MGLAGSGASRIDQGIRHGRKPCGGLTIIELLVVIVIIALLIAILIPAVNAARETARRISCGQKLKQIAIAVENYQGAHQYYPPSMTWTEGVTDSAAKWSALARLLPYLEEDVVFRTIDFSLPVGDSPASAQRIPAYLCPSEMHDVTRFRGNQPAHFPLNYGLNMGVWLVYDPRLKAGGQGIFFPNARLQPRDVKDGLSHTFCAAEVKAYTSYYRNGGDPGERPMAVSEICALGGQAKMGPHLDDNSGHTEWVDGQVHQTGFTAAFTPQTAVLCDEQGATHDVDWSSASESASQTDPTYAAITSRSYHPAGVNTVLLDSSVRLITGSVDLAVWRALATRASGDETDLD